MNTPLDLVGKITTTDLAFGLRADVARATGPEQAVHKKYAGRQPSGPGQ